MTWFYRRWGMVLALAGPASWLGAMLYFLWVLLMPHGPWAGLAALVYCAEVLFWLHLLLMAGLLGWVASRQLRGLPIGGWAQWGLIYYGTLPLVILVVLVSTVGLRTTGEVVRYLLRAPWLLEQLGPSSLIHLNRCQGAGTPGAAFLRPGIGTMLQQPRFLGR